MSYNSRRTIATMIVGVALVIAYIIYALGKSAPSSGDIKSWAIAMLIFIGIGIVASIIIVILFQILSAIGIAIKEREKDDEEVERIISSSMVEDERDKIISLKSNFIGYCFAGFGFVAALVALAFGMTYLFALHVAMGAFVVGSLAEGIVSIVYYERGV